MARLDQSTWHRVDPDSLPVEVLKMTFSVSSVRIQECGRYPEKTDLLMLADRPPLLETPLHHFLNDLTPNDAYFVRWHYAGLPTSIDLRTFRLSVAGAVTRPLLIRN